MSVVTAVPMATVVTGDSGGSGHISGHVRVTVSGESGERGNSGDSGQ